MLDELNKRPSGEGQAERAPRLEVESPAVVDREVPLVTGPAYEPPSFDGSHISPVSVSTETGRSSSCCAGVRPEASAAAYTKGLKAEPGCRRALNARLNPPRS